MSQGTLTKPEEPKYPGSFDNVNDDLIVKQGDVLISSMGVRWVP